MFSRLYAASRYIVFSKEKWRLDKFSQPTICMLFDKVSFE